MKCPRIVIIDGSIRERSQAQLYLDILYFYYLIKYHNIPPYTTPRRNSHPMFGGTGYHESARDSSIPNPSYDECLVDAVT